jgi:hypothetical protein
MNFVHIYVVLFFRTDSTVPGLDIIFDTETNSHQYWHKMQLLAKGGTYVLLGLLARSLNDPWDKASIYLACKTVLVYLCSVSYLKITGPLFYLYIYCKLQSLIV